MGTRFFGVMLVNAASGSLGSMNFIGEALNPIAVLVDATAFGEEVDATGDSGMSITVPSPSS